MSANPLDDLPPPGAAQGAVQSASANPLDDLPPPQHAPAPAGGHPNLANEMVGYGDTDFPSELRRSVGEYGTGIKQIAMHIGNHLGLISDDDVAKNQAEFDEQRAHPPAASKSTAGQLGYVAGKAAPLLVAPELGVLGSGVLGVGMGAAEPTATGESRDENMAMGGLGAMGGSLLGKGVQAIAQPMKNTLSDVGKSAVQTLKDAGIPLDLAQETGSRLARTLKNIIADNPLIGPSSFPEEQGHVFNRAVLDKMGITDPAVNAADDVTMQAGRKAITKVMDDVAERNPVKYDSQLENDLARIEKNAPKSITPDNLATIRANLNEIMESAAENGGQIPGLVYQQLRSDLGGLSKDARLQPVAHDIQEAIDDALGRSASKADQEAYVQARQHYRAMKQIEGAIDPASGDISPDLLLNKINTKSNRNQSIYGQGDQSLVDLAKAAKTVLGKRGNPDSGTARRLAGMAAMGAIAGGGDELLHGNPSEALKVGALGAALPYAGRQLVEHPTLVKGITKWNDSPGVAGVTSAIRKGTTAAGATTGEDEQSSPIERASGGKVDVDSLVNRLMSRWKSAKRETDESTKPLLKVPDATITRALEIAKAHI